MKSKVTYNIDDDSIRAIRRLAIAEERSRSSIVNRILREALADADLKPVQPTDPKPETQTDAAEWLKRYGGPTPNAPDNAP